MTEKNGHLAGLTTVDGQEDIMVMTNQGVMIRFNVATVSQTGRATLGVRLMRLGDDGQVATMAKVDPEPEVDETVATDATTEAPVDDQTVNADATTTEPTTDSNDSNE